MSLECSSWGKIGMSMSAIMSQNDPQSALAHSYGGALHMVKVIIMLKINPFRRCHLALLFPLLLLSCVSPNLENQMSLLPPLTRLVLSTATYTPTIGPTRTPKATLTPTSTPLVTSNPSDEEVIRLLFEGRDLPLGTSKEIIEQEVAAGKMSYEFTRQDVDLNGDGQPEILFYGPISHVYVYFGILGRANGVWQPWWYADEYGKYCMNVKGTVSTTYLLVDFLSCGGGTGQVYLGWEQQWVECKESGCTVVWSAPLLLSSWFSTWGESLDYAVTELVRPDSNTIQLTTRRFGVMEVLIYGPSPWANPAYRLVGPDTVEIFKLDGTTYQLEERTEIAPEYKMTHEFDLERQETVRLVDQILSDEHSGEAFAVPRPNFWGYPSPTLSGNRNQRVRPSSRSPDAAAHNGSPHELGEWVASIIGAKHFPLCRLTIQQYDGQELELFERRKVPCTANFTRLEWADITGDSQDELLLLTIPPESRRTESVQRVHIYAVEDKLVELATLDGHLNGPDGVGIRWQDYDDDGTIDEIVVGRPILNTQSLEIWPTLTREFEVYRWDMARQRLIRNDN